MADCPRKTCRISRKSGLSRNFQIYLTSLDTFSFFLRFLLGQRSTTLITSDGLRQRCLTPAAWKAATGLFWILLFLRLSGSYYNDLLTGDKYMAYGFAHRVFILHMLGFTTRLKYYGVWSLTEGACILSGLGYKGVDPVTGKVSWDRLRNVSPWGVESAQNTRAYLGNWNINTNNWLRNYMYLRVTPRGKKPGFRASMATFVTSAFWHGFYPGYYLSFVLASFVQTVAKSLFYHVPILVTC
jgi:lysophospholipid acyltransferase